ncbi:fatty acid desaturase-domain-containing protein [Roridomyces roridus]|uniref:Fatty acid desaturase-domain-containing protein n=1 Tax=Roridomyces roridus TaxID=1738132 RepID=A0AAD7FDF3_9AGAR|nr:fatty acid desaturase-domain-containing protein [Roridomyces roridus]
MTRVCGCFKIPMDCQTTHSPSDGESLYTPMPWKLQEIRAAIPAHCFERSASRSLLYLSRDLLLATGFWFAATAIDPCVSSLGGQAVVEQSLRWLAWCCYWWFQGLVFTGIWVIGHECGHGAFSPYKTLNNTIGFIIHSLLWTPYFSWKISHHRHHISHASMERDEVYVPKTRSELGIPPTGVASRLDYAEIFGDTPIFTLLILIRQQLFAFPAYLLFNSSGQRRYPKWTTNHFMPNSILFTPGQRGAVIMSNIGLLAMVFAIRKAISIFGLSAVLKYYGVPWLAVTHWFVMITYLHHTDPVIPHYRGKEWNFQRGAAATIDRDFLGWQGTFFLHSVARYHVIHHFFPKMPFYHAEEATRALKAFIGNYYMFSNKPAFTALWDNYNSCQFVEDEGQILFYRDKKGHAVRRSKNAV